jgi:hypothetical protein
MKDQEAIDPTDVLTPEQYREMAEREAATEATKEVIEKHIDDIMKLREKFPLDDMDLLSANITHRRNVPKNVKQQIAALQAKMAMIIEEVALRIEAPKYKSPQEVLSTMKISYNEKTRANSLISAEKHVHISCQSSFPSLTSIPVRRLRRRGRPARSGWSATWCSEMPSWCTSSRIS